jgi:small subunit ribosomal protein S1
MDLVPLSEFRDFPGLKIGDEVDLFIEEQENSLGQLVLSRKKAKMVSAWQDIEDALGI